MEPCKHCNETHLKWWDECEASVIAQQAWLNRPKEPEPEPTTHQPVGWIHPSGVQRIKRNTGVLRLCAFDERISNSANDAQTFPLYPPLPKSMMVVKREDVEALLMLIDPPPLVVEGKTLVFNNPMAAEVIRDLSNRVRDMLENAKGLVTL